MFSESPAAAEQLLSQGMNPDLLNDDFDRPWDIAHRKCVCVCVCVRARALLLNDDFDHP